MFKVLAINPGSTSTKVAFYQNNEELFAENISHSAEELASYGNIIEQLQFRLNAIKKLMQKNNVVESEISAVVGRGGLLRPMISGTYSTNKVMLDDLEKCRYGAHASNLGAILADKLAGAIGCPSYIVDPVVVDELEPVARITGIPDIQKRSIFHALNQKAVAKRFVETINGRYEDLNLIVVHLGGGISVGCHKQGKVVEVNNALDGEGPFTPERAGTVQALQFFGYVKDNAMNDATVLKTLAGKGGLVAHLGTNDARAVEKRIAEGDKKAQLVYDAMIYNIARFVAAAAIPVSGMVDYIIITGGIAHSKYVTEKLRSYIRFLAPVVIIPGEDELKALAEGAIRVLQGKEAAKNYE